jgi:hypothetical protein
MKLKRVETEVYSYINFKAYEKRLIFELGVLVESSGQLCSAVVVVSLYEDCNKDTKMNVNAGQWLPVQQYVHKSSRFRFLLFGASVTARTISSKVRKRNVVNPICFLISSTIVW